MPRRKRKWQALSVSLSKARLAQRLKRSLELEKERLYIGYKVKRIGEEEGKVKSENDSTCEFGSSNVNVKDEEVFSDLEREQNSGNNEQTNENEVSDHNDEEEEAVPPSVRGEAGPPPPRSFASMFFKLKAATPTSSSLEPISKPNNSDKGSKTSSDLPPRYCLVCFRETKFNVQECEDLPDSETDFLAMFVLRKILDVPRETLETYLKAHGSPKDWISFCHLCSPVIIEGFTVQKKINEMEKTLRKCQEQIQGEMLALARTRLKAKVNALAGVNQLDDHLKITSEVWNFVTKGISTEPTENEDMEDDINDISPPSPYHNESDGYISNDEISSSPPTHQNDQEKLSPVESTPLKKISQPYYVRPADRAAQATLFNCVMCPSLKAMKCYSFVRHVNYHRDRPFQCTECDRFSTGSLLELVKLPKMVHQKDGVDHNHICSRETLVPVEFQHGKLWNCAHCLEAFSSDPERTSHENEAHSSEPAIKLPHRCTRCGTKFRNFVEWQIHRALEHPDLSKFGCFHCDKIFKLPTNQGIDILDIKRRRRHVKKDHKKVLYCHDYNDCDMCGCVSILGKDHMDHMEKEHGLDAKDAYACPICFVRWEKKISWLIHLLYTHGKKSQDKLMCDICAYETVTKVTLREHKLVKHGILPDDGVKIHICSEGSCEFQTSIIGNLRRHMMKDHDAPRPHTCQTCGKGFLNAKNLKEHQLIHENVTTKPFQCELCGNSFAVKNYLYIHMRLSHQNRPFASTHKKRPSKKSKKMNVSSEGNSDEAQQPSSSVVVQAPEIGAEIQIPIEFETPFPPLEALTAVVDDGQETDFHNEINVNMETHLS